MENIKGFSFSLVSDLSRPELTTSHHLIAWHSSTSHPCGGGLTRRRVCANSRSQTEPHEDDTKLTQNTTRKSLLLAGPGMRVVQGKGKGLGSYPTSATRMKNFWILGFPSFSFPLSAPELLNAGFIYTSLSPPAYSLFPHRVYFCS